MDRPSRDTAMMESAAIWTMRSTCSRAQVGSVLCTPDYRILISGYNGAPPGRPHCDHDCDCGKGRPILGGHMSYCASVTPCRQAVHAEANSIAFAAKHGVGVEGGQLFSTLAPCLPCAMLLLTAGISRIVWRDEHRDMSGVEFLDNAGLVVVKYSHD